METPSIAVGSLFRFADQPSILFKVVTLYLAAGFIPSVVGHTLDGKFKTCARIADIQEVQS